GIAEEKIVLRRNGVTSPAKMPEPGMFRSSLGLPADVRLILFLGRMSQKKSPDLLLKAFAEIASTETNTHLAFVGPDESGMRGRLRGMAERSGLGQRVHFAGPLTGALKWAAYGDAEIFVLPSLNENFGNTAAEAVAAGTPVVVTRQCGIAPLLDGIAGLVVEHE